MTWKTRGRLFVGIILAACMGIYSFAGSVPGAGILTKLKPIVLHAGINKIPDIQFPNIHKTGQIIVTMRDNADAFGATYVVYQTVIPDNWRGVAYPTGLWHVAGIETLPGTVVDFVHDDRLDGDAQISVQFARGRIKNKPENLLFIARRDKAEDAGPTPVTMEVYKLITQSDVSDADGTLRTPQHYLKILTTQTSHRYCNTDMALHQALGFALPANYSGSKRDDGCRAGTYRRNITVVRAAKMLDPRWGVVFPGEKARKLLSPCMGGSVKNVAGTWTPDAAQIADLEKKLSPQLAAQLKQTRSFWAHPGDYYRQYGGYLSGGHRLIFVNGFSRNVFRPDFDGSRMLGDTDWTRKTVNICDGGPEFFQAIYDPDAHFFTSFGFNGQG